MRVVFDSNKEYTSEELNEVFKNFRQVYDEYFKEEIIKDKESSFNILKNLLKFKK